MLAGCILYGLPLGIRSSRKLEDAAANRLDFIRLLEGRIPDHVYRLASGAAFDVVLK